MSNEPSGAIDKDFDESARDPEAILTDRLDAFPREVKGGDVVIDLVQGRPLYVRRQRGTAVEYFESEDFDLTTYKAHPWLPITPDDTIFECVFLPTNPESIPTAKKDKTYDYPRGRLARVPVEWLYDSGMRPQEDQKRALLAAMFANADDLTEGSDSDLDLVESLYAVARATFGNEAVADAAERAGLQMRTAEENGSELGDFE